MLYNNDELHVGIRSATDIVNARMKARDLAVDLGFDGSDLNLITSAISGMAGHIANHAASGEVILVPVNQGDRRSLTVVAHDKGPGLKDIVTAMQFGYSTNDSLGGGRPGTKWLQAEFDLGALTERQREEKMLRFLSGKILKAQEEERRRISRELHDEVGQSLTAIGVALATLQQGGATDPKTFSQTIAGAQQMIETTMEKVHRFAHELRPAMLDHLGLLPALRSHLKNFAACTGLHLKFSADAAAERLDGEQKTALFRILQESLTNVAKHAGASCVKIFLGQSGDDICLEIADNGKSFRAHDGNGADPRPHLGLLGMRERVQSVNGRFVIRPEPGRGTTVRVTIPFPARAVTADGFNREAKDVVYEKNPSAAGRRPYHRPARIAHAAGDRSGTYGGGRSRNGAPGLGTFQASPA